jgi:hypothetical protein
MSFFATGSTMKPSPSRAVAPRTASSPGSPKATCTGAFLPSKVTSTAVKSRSKRRPSASEKGNREKAVTPNFWRTPRGIHDKVAPVSTNNEISSVRPGAVRLANFTFTSNIPIAGISRLHQAPCTFASNSTNFCFRSAWSWPPSASAICVMFIEQNFGPHIEQNLASL